MSFGADLRRFADKTGRKMDDVVGGFELALFTAVILDSPVDTGRFRGNWQISVNRFKNGTVEGDDPTGAKTIALMDSFIQSLKGGRVTFMVNNLPYSQRLEHGYSDQAPAGMVRKNTARFSSLLKAEVAEHK